MLLTYGRTRPEAVSLDGRRWKNMASDKCLAESRHSEVRAADLCGRSHPYMRRDELEWLTDRGA